MSEKEKIERIIPEYEYDELALLLPEMSPEEFQALKEDIEDRGLDEPILLFEDKIIDGRNRHKALRELEDEGKLPKNINETDIFKKFDGNKGEATEQIFAKNVLRRRLSNAQCQFIGVELMRKLEEADDNDEPVANMPRDRARDRAAKVLKINSRSIGTAGKAMKNLIPEFKEYCKRGFINPSLALKISELKVRDQKKTYKSIDKIRSEHFKDKEKNEKAEARKKINEELKNLRADKQSELDKLTNDESEQRNAIDSDENLQDDLRTKKVETLERKYMALKTVSELSYDEKINEAEELKSTEPSSIEAKYNNKRSLIPMSVLIKKSYDETVSISKSIYLGWKILDTGYIKLEIKCFDEKDESVEINDRFILLKNVSRGDCDKTLKELEEKLKSGIDKTNDSLKESVNALIDGIKQELK